MVEPSPRPIVVLGMHRSGTSLAAALLQAAGIHIGTRLFGPRQGNVRGHFENLDFVELHIRALRARGLPDSGFTTTTGLSFTTAEQDLARQLVTASSVAGAWGWKDPRTTLFLESWNALVDEACYLVVFRSPWETADSLYRRHSSEDVVFAEQPGLAIETWTAYNQVLLDFASTHAGRCLVMSVRSLVRRPEDTLAALNARFGFALKTQAAHVAQPDLLRPVGDEQARAAAVAAFDRRALGLFRSLLSRSDLPLERDDAAWAHERRLRRRGDALLQDWRDARAFATAASLLRDQLTASGKGTPAAELEAEVHRLGLHLDEAIRNAASERDRFTAELVSAERRAEASAAEVGQARAELERLQFHLAEAIANAEAERQRFMSELTSAERRAGTSAGEAAQAGAELERLRLHLDEAIANAKTERQRFTSELTSIERRAATAAAEAVQARVELERLQVHLDEAIRNAAAERELAASRLMDANRAAIEAASALSAAEAALAEADRRAAQATERAARVEDTAERESAEARRRAAQLTQALAQAQAEIDAASNAAAKALSLGRDLERQAAKERTALTEQVQAAEARAAAALGDLAAARAEVERLAYYLGETMRNAVADRERLQRALGNAQAAYLALDSEGVKRTARRLRQKAWRKAVWLAEHRTPGAVHAWRRARASLASLGRRRSTRRARDGSTVRAALDQLEPLLAEASRQPGEGIRLSILTPTWNTPPALLADTATSVLRQTSGAWEWCIVDDGSTDPRTGALLSALADRCPRIVVRPAAHGGIAAATNAALALARGAYVCFLDHDDLLAPDAVQEVLNALDAGFDAVYTDEDKTDAAGSTFFEPFHKPDWSPEYLRGVMYVGHLLALRRDLVEQVGGLDGRFDGVQDFELALRIGEAGARIGHVPKVLYHWRQVAGSVAADPAAKEGIERLQQAAVDAHLARVGLAAASTAGAGAHRVRIVPAPRDVHPRVSIIIPTCDAPRLLGRCFESLYSRTAYPSFEVLAVDNDSKDPEALATMHRYPVRRVPFPGTFNYSKANNLGASQAEGQFLVFLNNDTEVLSGDWLEQMLYYAEQRDVGAVGALLLYPDRTVQHAGIVLGFRGTADHVMRGFPSDVDGYAGSLACAREVTAVTGACLMIGADRFHAVGGFNEHFATHYQDVDFCLRLRRANLRNVFTPRAVLLHFESSTRGPEYDMLDRLLLLDGWEADIEAGDPYYNPRFDLTRHDYTVRQPS